jgi:hypothetical protein
MRCGLPDRPALMLQTNQHARRPDHGLGQRENDLPWQPCFFAAGVDPPSARQRRVARKVSERSYRARAPSESSGLMPPSLGLHRRAGLNSIPFT